MLKTFQRQRPGSRFRGISLLEVLISMFVLVVGLLGVAAVIPLGRLEIDRANQSHRSTALGRNQIRKLQISSALDPLMWLKPTGSANGVPLGSYEAPANLPFVCYYPTHLDGKQATYGNPDGAAPGPGWVLRVDRSYVLDPLLIAQNTKPGMGSDIGDFPMRWSNMNLVSLPLVRLTLRTFRPGSWIPALDGHQTIDPALAERLFSGWDDQLFTQASDSADRPRQLMRSLNASTDATGAFAYPKRPGEEPVDVPFLRESTGEYTYMITIMPLVHEYDFMAVIPSPGGGGASNAYYSFLDNVRLEVSVVVFRNRDFTDSEMACFRVMKGGKEVPGERTVMADLLGTASDDTHAGKGGGEFMLKTEFNGAPNLAVDEGNWILLRAAKTHPRSRANNDSRIPPTQPIKWYRVASVGELNTDKDDDTAERRVTLVGPDWPYARLGADDTLATLMTNIVGVYTTTVQLDPSTVWGQSDPSVIGRP